MFLSVIILSYFQWSIKVCVIKMKHIGYYFIGLALLTLVLISLNIKGLFDAASIEKDKIDHQISSAVCNTFEQILTDDSYEIEVRDCDKLGNGSFQLIANADKCQLENVISRQLQMEDHISFPYQISVKPSSGKSKLSQASPGAEESFQTAYVNVNMPPLHNVFLTGWGTELVLLMIISSIMVWTYYNISIVLRNSKSFTYDPEVDTIQIGKYSFDVRNQALSLNDKKRRITAKECQVLRYLCNSKNQITRRDDILMALWGENDYFKGRSLDVFISRLRKYLSEDETIKIETVHGVGFILTDK